MGAAYNFYVFNREGVCLYYAEWQRPKPVSEGAGSAEDDAKVRGGPRPPRGLSGGSPGAPRGPGPPWEIVPGPDAAARRPARR